MAFPKAEIKRFNEMSGCAPPVGTYDPKDTPSKVGIALDKSDRFRESKDITPGPGNCTFDNGISKSQSGTPMKQNLSRTSSNESLKMKKPAVPDENAFKIRALEKDIKKLVLEQSEKDRQLQHKDEELRKLEGKLQGVQSERSTLQSRLAALERDNKDLTKGNDILKNKLKTSDATLKKKEEKLDGDLHDLKKKLETKDREAAKERASLEEALKEKEEKLKVELEDMKRRLEKKEEEAVRERKEVEASITSLVAEVTGLESLTQTLEETAAAIASKVNEYEGTGSSQERQDSLSAKKVTGMLETSAGDEKTAKDKLCIIRDSLKTIGEDVSQWAVNLGRQLVTWETAMHGQVSQTQQQMLGLQTLLTKSQENLESNQACSQALRQYRETLEAENEQLKELVKEMKLAEQDYLETIRSLKGEMHVLDEEKRNEEQLAFEANAETAMLMEEVEKEEEHKAEIMSSLRSMTDKYHALEAALLTEQEEKFKMTKSLKAQVEHLKSRLEAADRDHQQLQQTNSRLVADSQHDKVEIEKFSQENKDLISRLTELSQENDDLSQQVETARGKATEAKAHAESRAVVIQLMQKQLTATREESDRLREVVALQTQRADTLERQLSSVQGNESVVSKQLSELTASHRQVVDTYQQQVADLEAEKQRLIEEKHAVEDTLTHLATAKEELQAQLLELKAETEEKEKLAAAVLEERAKEVGALEEKVEEMKEQHKVEISQRASQLLSVQARLGEAQHAQAYTWLLHQASTEQFDLQLSEANYQAAFTQQLLHDAEEKHQLRILEEAEKLSSLSDKLQEKDDSITSLGERLAEAEHRHADLQKKHECNVLDRDEQILALREKLTAAESSLEKFDAEMQTLCIEKDAEVAVLMDKVESQEKLVQELEHEVVSYEKHIACLQNQIASDRVSVAKCEEEVAKKDELIADLEVKITSVVATEQELQAKLMSLVEENSKHTMQLEHEIQVARSSVEEQRKQLEAEKKSMEDTQTQLQKALARKEEEVGRLEECMNNLRGEFSSVQSSMKAFEAQLKAELEKEGQERERTTEMLHASETVCQEMQQKLQAAEIDIQALESRYEEDVEMKDVQITQLQATISTLEMALENAAAMHGSQLSEKNDEVQMLATRLEIAESAAKRMKEQSLEKTREMEALAAKMKALEDWHMNDAKAKDARLRSLGQQLEEQRRELVEMGRKADMADTLSQALAAKAAQISRLQTEMLEKQAHAEEKVAQAEADLANQLLELQTTQDKCEMLEAELEHRARQHEEKDAQIRAMEDRLAEFSHEETEKWRMMYEELQAKVAPFIEQLDAYELERQALLGRSQFAQSEMDKLSREYARVLGHQNQKQKIKHIIKIKEENNALKKEVSDLREQCAKQKRSLQRLEERQAAAEGKKRFDPKKAFASAKENAPSPLKDDGPKVSWWNRKSAMNVTLRRHYTPDTPDLEETANSSWS